MRQLSQKDKAIVAAKVAARLNGHHDVAVVYNGKNGSPPYDVSYIDVVSQVKDQFGLVYRVWVDLEQAVEIKVSEGCFLDLKGSVYVIAKTASVSGCLDCEVHLANAVKR